MLQVGVLKPVHEATPWINSFVLVECNDTSGSLKLRICLDPTNLNKAIVRELYHFKTPEDIAHLLADACIMTKFVIVEEGTGTSSLMRLLHFSQPSIQSLEGLGTMVCHLVQLWLEMYFSISWINVLETSSKL